MVAPRKVNRIISSAHTRAKECSNGDLQRSRQMRHGTNCNSPLAVMTELGSRVAGEYDVLLLTRSAAIYERLCSIHPLWRNEHPFVAREAV